jgi:hypothetical protein
MAERNAEDAARAVQRLRMEKDQWHDSAVHAERQLAADQPQLQAGNRAAAAWRAMKYAWNPDGMPELAEALDALAEETGGGETELPDHSAPEREYGFVGTRPPPIDHYPTPEPGLSQYKVDPTGACPPRRARVRECSGLTWEEHVAKMRERT